MYNRPMTICTYFVNFWYEHPTVNSHVMKYPQSWTMALIPLGVPVLIEILFLLYICEKLLECYAIAT